MLNNCIAEIDKKLVSLKKIASLSDALKQKLEGSLLLEAEKNIKEVDAYTFLYTTGDMTVAGFLVAPKVVNDKLPVIIYNRGGTEDYGIVKPGLLLTHLANIAKQGYLVIGTQYPGNSLSEGHDERGGEADLKAVEDIYNIIKDNKHINKNRIAMYGFSRGGMMTYLSLKKFPWIKTAIILAGSADLTAEVRRRPEMHEIFMKSFGDTEEGRRDRSAVLWPTSIANVPILLLHAKRDPRVDSSDSIKMAKLLKKDLSNVILHLIDSDDHALNDRKTLRDELVLSWLRNNL